MTLNLSAHVSRIDGEKENRLIYFASFVSTISHVEAENEDCEKKPLQVPKDPTTFCCFPVWFFCVTFEFEAATKKVFIRLTYC